MRAANGAGAGRQDARAPSGVNRQSRGSLTFGGEGGGRIGTGPQQPHARRDATGRDGSGRETRSEAPQGPQKERIQYPDSGPGRKQAPKARKQSERMKENAYATTATGTMMRSRKRGPVRRQEGAHASK
ncbi:unnamed protein product [Pleuronectes platessa]|uniref:Uncharacterized protein n=1 Tax=Pleuronectes platessa TaxID=8262 RepID=A0A9N7TUW0_PLEPL|nr:unnamed protein product [Pleuronectes platessa]